MGFFNPLSTIGAVFGGLPGWLGANAVQGNFSSQGGSPGGNPYASILNSEPTYTPGYTPEMALAPKFEQDLGQVNYDPSGVNALKGEATRQGPGQLSQLGGQRQAELSKLALGQARAGARGTAAESMSNLAASGGLSSGAKERIQRSAQNNYAGAAQQIKANEADQNRQLAMQDEQNRLGMLSQLPNAQNQAFAAQLEKPKLALGARGVDLQNQIAENQARNQFNQNNWAAKTNALAMAASAPQGGFLSRLFGG